MGGLSVSRVQVSCVNLLFTWPCVEGECVCVENVLSTGWLIKSLSVYIICLEREREREGDEEESRGSRAFIITP